VDGNNNTSAASSAAASAMAPAPPPLPFGGFVIGIGASAGGLDALERLFGALPADSGAAFVVVQHLSPDHKSMMDNLLARYTQMPVRVVEHEMALAPNAVFLIPPAREMRISSGRLLLAPKPEHVLSLPIDVFFGSLAEHCADRALAVVLSGTGSDGSRGVVAVNAGGGFVFVQEPASAKFDGMPRSAIATGLADAVATPEELAQRLMAHVRAPAGSLVRLPLSEDGGAVEALPPLEAIFERLHAGSGIDFRDYKPSTVMRRIERRMQVLRTPTLGEYAARLAASGEEQMLLRRELLIPVTRFFREPEAWDQLAEDVITPLMARPDNPTEPVRAWVACCATGEEAYTLAILFAEAALLSGRQRPVKIFATDVEPHYLDQAAVGFYPDTIAAEVSPERLARYFMERPGGYAIRPEIRQTVIFARHNLVADPPFTRMDVVTCRNALIYFQPAAQERALRRLQYALHAGAALMLGSSESPGALHRDFSAHAGRSKIYRLLRRDRSMMAMDSGGRRHMPTANTVALRRGGSAGMGANSPPEAHNAIGVGQRLLLSHYAPPSLLVGPGRELLQTLGNARDWLSLPDGEATLDVLRLLPRELASPAALLLGGLAGRKTEPAAPQRSPLIRVPGADPTQPMRLVRLVARPLPEDEAGSSGVTLLSIEDADLALPGPALEPMAALDVEQQRRIEALERELDLTHDNLQATIEELETANEELQATNEELMASNEELQSTNEELQSVNEELYTVNSEFQEKVDVLNGVNADLENIVRASGIPTLFVDEALHLTRFTPELVQLFKVRESDRGRSIEDFAHQLDYPELFADLRRTLADGKVHEREVKSRNGDWWYARIQPYHARGSGGARAVMTFFNVSSLKDAQHLQAVLDSLAEHVAVVDAKGTITLVNAAWRRFAIDNGDAQLAHSGPGANYLSVCARAALSDPDAHAAHEGLAAVLEKRAPVFTLQYPCHTADRKLWFLMHVAPVAQPDGGAVVSHIDITSWAEREADLQ
jgi:two-component system, chemotaxis family, CheB/CheR fusion protein